MYDVVFNFRHSCEIMKQQSLSHSQLRQCFPSVPAHSISVFFNHIHWNPITQQIALFMYLFIYYSAHLTNMLLSHISKTWFLTNKSHEHNTQQTESLFNKTNTSACFTVTAVFRVCCLRPVVSVSVFSSIPVGFLFCWHRCAALSRGTCVLGFLLMQTESFCFTLQS